MSDEAKKMTINRMSTARKILALGVLAALLTGCAGTQSRVAETALGNPEVALNTDNLELVKEAITLEMETRGAVLQSDSGDQLVFSRPTTGTNTKQTTLPDATIFFTISKTGRMIRVVPFAQTREEDASGNDAWVNQLREILRDVGYDVDKSSTAISDEAKPKPQPKPEPKPEPKPQPKPEPEPELNTESRPKTEPRPEPEPKPVAEEPAQKVQQTIKYRDGSKYVGGIKAGRPDGSGTFTWPSGARYVGDWSAGTRTGAGTYRWANGDQYDGQWLADRRNGMGTMVYKNGETKAGLWRNDVYIGSATNAVPAVASEPRTTP